ncbi:creatininase family protein [Gaoshiqia sediminis]|uniref:Creatininase family protein n=1 Tax=Gaoshiqia sediminis TaxID=2986998 RepID=A0AA41Y5P7_9BACT|nr:creatininase family protein [Gaoshiqia sediminis]MCW0483906.1 creatininase family protein [Gaoshiqia sediminis]
MSKQLYNLSASCWADVKQQTYDVAVLPWGAIEPHNYHLPFATDVIQAEAVALESARLAWEEGARVIVLPTVPWGVNTGQLDLKLCLNMMPSTQLVILKDLVENLKRHGIQKLILVNGHGGNNFIPMIRELSVTHPEVFICCIDWWKVCKAETYFDEPGDHAGELETSVMMHLVPGLVLPLDIAGDGSAKNFKPEGLKARWAWAQRQWTSITESTGVGNPKQATAEKGAHFLNDVTQKIAKFITELSSCNINEIYE